MKKWAINILKGIGILYLLMCGLMFFFQEKMIFFPQVLDINYTFEFEQEFEEINIITEDQKHLHGLLFPSENSRGLVYYLHGNGGSLAGWGRVAKTYTDLNYDVFLLDYRGYGKSEGKIQSEAQMYQDVQSAYRQLLKSYKEESIVVIGYSIGTGPAAQLASTNSPGMLILQAPYYSLTDMMRHTYKFIPSFLLKYKFNTSKYVQECEPPIVLFHGDADELIYYESSVKLKQLIKPTDILITLEGQGHNGMTDNPQYLQEIERILTD